MTDNAIFSLSKNPAHLGLSASVTQEETFTGEMEWYARYVDRHMSDGVEGRLVVMHSFDESWLGWEMHPLGEELVVCTEGSILLIQEIDGVSVTTRLSKGEATINPRGVWHTADVDEPVTVLFVTAGAGTQNRPR